MLILRKLYVGGYCLFIMHALGVDQERPGIFFCMGYGCMVEAV